MTAYVLVHFKLRPEDSIESYRKWSIEYIRPIMNRMPSVSSFTDFHVYATPEGPGGWDGVEIITVRNVAEFETDNTHGDGETLALSWRERLDAWSIEYLRDLAADIS